MNKIRTWNEIDNENQINKIDVYQILVSAHIKSGSKQILNVSNRENSKIMNSQFLNF